MSLDKPHSSSLGQSTSTICTNLGLLKLRVAELSAKYRVGSGEGKDEENKGQEREDEKSFELRGKDSIPSLLPSPSQIPRILAVSKLHPAESILTAHKEGGQIHFGENYAQELIGKAVDLPSTILWHFIGHLQRNKCNSLLSIPNLHCIESVDSIELLNKLEQVCQREGRKVNVLVQVKTAEEEESKTGCALEEATSLVTHICQTLKNINFCGLMTVGCLDGDTAKNSECFLKLVKIRDELFDYYKPFTTQVDPPIKMCDVPDTLINATRPIRALDILAESKEEAVTEQKEFLPRKRDKWFWSSPAHFELSMGMSGDLEEAIKMGSTEVRVGSFIFGQRPKA